MDGNGAKWNGGLLVDEKMRVKYLYRKNSSSEMYLFSIVLSYRHGQKQQKLRNPG
jgi:hypothetical protein